MSNFNRADVVTGKARPPLDKKVESALKDVAKRRKEQGYEWFSSKSKKG